MLKTHLDQGPQSASTAPFRLKPFTWLDESRLTEVVVPIGGFHAPPPQKSHQVIGYSGENTSLVLADEVSLVLQSGIEGLLGSGRKELEKDPKPHDWRGGKERP